MCLGMFAPWTQRWAGRDLVLLAVTFLRIGTTYVLPMGLLVQKKIEYEKKISYTTDFGCAISRAGVYSSPQNFTTLPPPSRHPKAPSEGCHQCGILSPSPNPSFFNEERKALGSSVWQSSHIHSIARATPQDSSLPVTWCPHTTAEHIWPWSPPCSEVAPLTVVGEEVTQSWWGAQETSPS